MTRETDVRNELRTFIIENFLFGKASVDFSDDDSLMEKSLIDSSGVLELIGFLEETYRIKVRDNELVPENLDSINNLRRYLDRKFADASHVSEDDLARRAIS